MSRVVNVHEAKTHLSRLLDEVRDGEEIILAKAGRPYARLVPFDGPGDRQLGFLPELAGLGDAVLGPLADDELEVYESEGAT
jgi:prevent-host-death family protein